MRSIDLVRFATKALTERKLRAALTIVGIMIGPATIVSLVGATQGYSNATSARFENLGATTLFVTPVGRGFTLTSSSLNDIENLAGVSYVLPYQQLGGQISQGGQTINVQIVAADLSQIKRVFPTLSVAQGSIPASSDGVGAIIGWSVAHPNIQGATNTTVDQVLTVSSLGRSVFAFNPESPAPTSTVTAQHSFVVRGVYNQFGQGFGINPDEAVFIPLASGEQILHSQAYTGVMVVASSTNTVGQVMSELTALYGQKVRIISVTSVVSSIQSVTQGISTLLETVGGTSVLVAFVGIMTTMLTSVLERTKEIGVLKALGSTSRGILLVFLAEALVTGLIGGFIGSAVGAALSYLVISFLTGSLSFGPFRGGPPGSAGNAASNLAISPVITPEVLFLGVLLAVAVGMLGGLLPAWRASQLTPVEAHRRA